MTGLRDYQTRAIAAVVAAAKGGYRSILVVAPTGAGKTRLACALILMALCKRSRILFICHRAELIKQTVGALLKQGIQCGVIAPWAPRTDTLVQVASIQTLLARGEIPEADLVILDEAHHYVSAEWGAIAKQLRRALVVGLTATPERSDGAPLGDLFQILIPVAQPRELIASGHLVPTDVWAPPRMAAGLMADPVEAFFDHPDTHVNGRPKRTIVFGQNVPHAQELAERFAARGLRTACVDGEMRWDDRIEAIARFSAGELDLLTNVYCLTEGLDVPAIEVIVLARGCGSQGTFIQMVGRGKRPSAGKTRSLLIDCKRAVDQHGLPDDDREYSLTGRAIRTAERLEPLRSCKRCGAVFAAAGRLCPRCGAPVPRPATPEERKAKLEHVRQVATVSEKRSYLEWLQREAKRLGHPAGWCAHRFKGKYGHFPPVQMWRAA